MTVQEFHRRKEFQLAEAKKNLEVQSSSVQSQKQTEKPDCVFHPKYPDDQPERTPDVETAAIILEKWSDLPVSERVCSSSVEFCSCWNPQSQQTSG